MTALLALFLGGFGLFGLLSQGEAASADIGESQRRLREIEGRIDKNYQELRSKEGREKTLRQDLDAVGREILTLEQRIGREEKKASSLLESIKGKEEEIQRIEIALKGKEGQIKERLKALYKGEETTLLQVFFSSDSPETAWENIDFLGKIVQRDQELLSGYRSESRKLEAVLQQLRELQDGQKSVLDGLKGDRESLGKAHGLNKKLLAQVEREKKSLSREIASLQERAKELTELIRKLEQEKMAEAAVEGGAFATQKGKLMWPLQGPVRIGFGTRKHPELETLYESQGIEIETSSGKPIAVVWNGKVAFANHFRGYGNLLIVNHGDGYHTLYAQAARLVKQVGDTVKKGEIVAYSGFEGSRSVYFEIRHRGVPQNPAQWLKRE